MIYHDAMTVMQYDTTPDDTLYDALPKYAYWWHDVVYRAICTLGFNHSCQPNAALKATRTTALVSAAPKGGSGDIGHHMLVQLHNTYIHDVYDMYV